jgi:hypothetical protein
MPEFQNESGQGDSNIIIPTPNDLVALWIQRLQNNNQTSDIQIVNTTDVDEFTKIVSAAYTVHDDTGTFLDPFDDFTFKTENFVIFVLSEDRNTGYYITNPMAIPNILNKTEHSAAVQEVFNSFEIVQEEE